jgi:hypothetical protein
MNNDHSQDIEIVEEHGSFLLIRAGSRFAVVEKRAGRIYPMTPGEREGEPLSAEGLAAAMAEEGWLSEDQARRQFDELCDEGDGLARALR